MGNLRFLHLLFSLVDVDAVHSIRVRRFAQQRTPTVDLVFAPYLYKTVFFAHFNLGKNQRKKPFK